MAQHNLTDTITFRRGLTIPNRIALAPMQSQSALEGGYASNDTIRYYNHRSKAAGLLITEFHYVSESGGPAYMPGYPSQMGIYSDVHLEGAKKIRDVGYSGVYHALRLREGTDSNLKPEKRKESIKNFLEAGGKADFTHLRHYRFKGKHYPELQHVAQNCSDGNQGNKRQ